MCDIEQQPISDQRKQEAKIKLFRYQSARGRKHRRISLAGVSDPTGKAITEPEQVAMHLADHWGKVHQ
eukprot:1197638-Pyramimonas_sp.AAC.1